MTVPMSETTALHVSLTRADLRHARQLLPHQLRALGGQVDKVLLTVDFGPTSQPGALAKADNAGLREWLQEMRSLHRDVDVREVPYDEQSLRSVSDTIFGGRPSPVADFRQRPIYSYLQPVLSAGARWVIHLDSDMFLGGGSQIWLAEARARLDKDSQAVLASPWPGPPRPDGGLLRQPDVRELEHGKAIAIPNMSSRIFLVDVEAFVDRLAPLPLLPAPWKGRLWAMRQRTEPIEKLELMVTHRMVQLGAYRIDLLGTSPGLWSLHPPFRSPTFYERLPEIIARVERGDLPEGQQGDYDLNDSVIDWSDARLRIRRERLVTLLRGASAEPTR
jgi:hypothetical protein